MVENRLELGNEHSHCSETAVRQNEVRGSSCGPDDICNFCFKHSWFNIPCGSGLGYQVSQRVALSMFTVKMNRGRIMLNGE
jgi:hypothetical protein